MDKFRTGHWACRVEIHPKSEEMKLHFTFYHVMLPRPESGNKHMIPAHGLRHAPAVAMLDRLVWFLESAVDKAQHEQWHCTSGVSLFIQGAIALLEQITGDARWEQTTEHSWAFSAIAVQLLTTCERFFSIGS
jgi:hypothetical protein